MITDPEVIRVPWQTVKKEYDSWIGLTQCESYVITFLAKHPEYIENNPKLGGGWNLAGIEVWLRRGPRGPSEEGSRADMIFTREMQIGQKDYLIIEAKNDCYEPRLAKGKKQAMVYAKLLADHLGRKFLTHNLVIPAVAAVDYPPTGPRGGLRGGWNCGEEW